MNTLVSSENNRAGVAADRAWRRSYPLRVLPFAVVVVLTFVLTAVQPTDHDVAWTLVAGRKILGGAIFGRDIVDVNLPWIYYIATAAVTLARLFGISDMQALTALIVITAAVSAGLIQRVLRVSHTDDSRFRYICVLAFFGTALLAPAQDFGQREQFISMLIAPYLVAIAARSERCSLCIRDAVPIGLLAGIAVLIKPHWAPLPVVMEIWLMVRTRSARGLLHPQPIAAAIATVLGCAATSWLAPLYASAMVPLALETYWAYNSLANARSGVGVAGVAILAMMPAILLVRTDSTAKTFRPLLSVFLVAGLAGLVIWVLQGKFFEYQALPVECLALWAGLAASAYIIATDAQAAPHLPFPRVWAPLPMMLAIAVIFLQWASSSVTAQARLTAVESALRRSGPVSSLYAFSTSMPVVFPLVNEFGATWPGRLQCLWPLPAALRPGPLSSQRQTAIGEWLRKVVVEDLTAAPPTAILVDTSQEKQGLPGQSFEFLPWFARSAEFQQLWSRYELRDEVSARGRQFQIWRLRGS